MMLRRGAMLLLTIILFVLQTTIFQSLPFITVAPNLLIILTASFALMRGSREGIITGVVCGFLVDIFFGPVLGVYALIYMYVGFLCGIFHKVFYPEDYKLPIAIVAISDLVYSFMVFFFMFLFRNRTSLNVYFVRIVLPEIVFTVVISIPLFFLFKKIDQGLDEFERRRSN